MEPKEAMSINRELGGIAEKIVSLSEKIEENHVVHVDNRKDIIQIKEDVKDLNTKVGIQNGRVTKNEKETIDLQKGMAEMMKLLSRHDGEILRRNKIEEEKSLFKRTLEEGVISKVVYIVIGVIAFALLQLILPNLEAANLLKFI